VNGGYFEDTAKVQMASKTALQEVDVVGSSNISNNYTSVGKECI
jgi:hypothetical protein